MAKRGELRDHLNLQVDLIAEKEIAKLLQIVQAICEHMGLKHIAKTRRWRNSARKPQVTIPRKNLKTHFPKHGRVAHICVPLANARSEEISARNLGLVPQSFSIGLPTSTQ